jgi:hypothetical protein
MATSASSPAAAVRPPLAPAAAAQCHPVGTAHNVKLGFCTVALAAVHASIAQAASASTASSSQSAVTVRQMLFTLAITAGALSGREASVSLGNTQRRWTCNEASAKCIRSDGLKPATAPYASCDAGKQHASCQDVKPASREPSRGPRLARRQALLRRWNPGR